VSGLEVWRRETAAAQRAKSLKNRIVDYYFRKNTFSVMVLPVPFNDPDGLGRRPILHEPTLKAKSLESSKVGLDLL
jgi:hypothetical protein